jgi:hypothetical protein
MLGLFDNTAWETCAVPPNASKLEPGTFRIDMTLLRFVQPLPGMAAAELDDIIVQRAVTVRDSA